MLKGCLVVVIAPDRKSGSSLSTEELADWIGANLYGVSRVLAIKAKPGKVNRDSLVIDFESETDKLVSTLENTLKQYGQVSEPMFLQVEVEDRV